MARLLILAHAPLASALQAVAAHTFPELVDRIRVVDVQPGDQPEHVEVKARSLLAGGPGVDGETLVLTDVFGATPANVAQRLADGQRVRVIAGVNVPMLWRALNYAQLPLEELASRAMMGGSHGVMPIATTRPQNQAHTTNVHDSIEHHHQQ
ncbi:PTS sugar transporter subunit IIA [Leptothrix sp. BB-4]